MWLTLAGAAKELTKSVSQQKRDGLGSSTNMLPAAQRCLSFLSVLHSLFPRQAFCYISLPGHLSAGEKLFFLVL